jgi:transposase InsO family protein
MPMASHRWICSWSQPVSFRLLYGFLILQHSRRKLVWLSVTAHPNAGWIARQLTEACAWQQAPRYVIRDRDCVYSGVFAQRLRAMGIRDQPIAPRSPWQNGCAERLIGSIRRDCLDHVVVFGEWHLRHLLKSYQKYYNEARSTCHCRRTRQSPAPCRPSVRRWPCLYWVGRTTNISERDFPTGTMVPHRLG